MNKLFKVVKAFYRAHKPVCLAAAGIIGAGAIGTGAYAAYNHFSQQPEIKKEEVKETPVAEAVDVYIPAFQKVFLTSESLEKDLTLYISSDGENCITGVPFQVKLLTPKAAEGMKPYVDAITEIDAQIAEYTADYPESFGASDATANETVSEADRILKILKDRNVNLTVTDANGEVVDTQKADIENDPLYKKYLDKETAEQAFSAALNEAEGTVYTDDDMDGVISQSDMKPGDYVAFIVNNTEDTNAVKYEPTSYKTDVNVKDKVELKVQKEIIKQVKKDAPAEDGQKKEVIPVESAPKDTVEFVESKKVEKSSTVKETTDVVAPKGAKKAGKATVKPGGTIKISYTPKAGTVKVTVVCKDDSGKEIRREVKEVQKGSNQTIAQPAIDGYEFVKVEGTNTFNAIASDQTVSFIYKKAVKTFDVIVKYTGSGLSDAKKTVKAGDIIKPEAVEGYTASPSQFTVAEGTTSYEFKYTANGPKSVTFTLNCVCDGSSIKKETVTKKSGESVSAPTIDGYTCSDGAKTVSDDTTSITFTYTKNNSGSDNSSSGEDNQNNQTEEQNNTQQEQQESNPTDSTKRIGKNRVAAASPVFTSQKLVNVLVAANTASTNVESAALDMTYSNGTFTISCSSNVSKVTVNGAEVKIENNKGTFKVAKDGDYTLTGIATFSDGFQDNRLKVTYTVSGYSAGTDEKLKDSEGHQLYVDRDCTQEATAADYEKGRTYYYKDAEYTYYGWQTINGRTFFFDKNGKPVTGTQVIQGVSYNFGTDGAIVANGTGIDVSKYQGAIDWKQAGPAVSFAIVRCGYRGVKDGQLHEDPYFYQNMKGAKSNGVNTGIYIYSTALSEAEAVAEASMAVAMANKAGGCALPIYIDMEDTQRGQSSLSNEQRTAIVNAFCTTVQSGGHKAGVYASKNWMTGKINTGSLPGSCSIWVAQYNTSCTYSGRYNMWQYSSKGSIPGIKGNVDMNKSYF